MSLLAVKMDVCSKNSRPTYPIYGPIQRGNLIYNLNFKYIVDTYNPFSV